MVDRTDATPSLRLDQEIYPFANKPILLDWGDNVCTTVVGLTLPLKKRSSRYGLMMELELNNAEAIGHDILPFTPEAGYIVTSDDLDPVKRAAKIENHLQSHPNKLELDSLILVGKPQEFYLLDGSRLKNSKQITTENQLLALRALRCLVRVNGQYISRIDDLGMGSYLEDCLFLNFYPTDIPELADVEIYGTGHGLRFSKNPAEYGKIGMKFIIDPSIQRG